MQQKSLAIFPSAGCKLLAVIPLSLRREDVLLVTSRENVFISKLSSKRSSSESRETLLSKAPACGKFPALHDYFNGTGT